MTWVPETLGNLVNVQTGKLDANASSEGGIYPFFTCAREPLRINRWRFDLDAVLVAGNGDLNVKHYIGKFEAYQRTYVLSSLDHERLDTRYLFHFMDKYVERLREQSIGGIIKYIKLGMLTDAQIPLPPLEEQKRIAAILDQADALRRLRLRALDRLNTLGHAIFFEMFGDPKVETDLWPTVSFAEACSDKTARSPKVQKGDYAAVGEIPVIDQGQKRIAGYTTSDNVCRTSGPVIVFGDHTRAVKYVDFDFSIGADGAKVLRASPQFDPRFLAALLAKLPIPDLGYSRHMREVKKLSFPKPPIELQILFSSRMKGLDLRAATLEDAAARSEKLFTSLQHRAFRGEL